MSQLYAIPTNHCNLHCPHCYVKDNEIFNKDLFLQRLNSFDGRIILFGGEPTSNLDRMWEVVQSNREYGISKISTISTNLTILNDDLIHFYQTLQGIATSWNPHRFDDEETYQLWLDHCKIISVHKIPYKILITLTEDLISMDPKVVINKINEFNTDMLEGIKFEQYVGNTSKDHFQKVDNWLCEIYKHWDSDIKFLMKEEIHHWYFDCDRIFTLYPDGTLINRCPQNLVSTIPSECYSCEKVSVCRPCRLQSNCSYPKKLAELIKGEENNE